MSTTPEQQLEEKRQQVLGWIQLLEDIEKNIYKKIHGTDVTQDEQAEIDAKIEYLRNTRNRLLNSLSSLYDDKQSRLNNDRLGLRDRITQIGIIDEELERTRHNITEMKDTQINKLRMAQLYQNERDRYDAYTEVMQYFVVASIGVLICVLLIKYKPIPMVPDNIYSYLMILFIAVAIIVIFRKVVDINRRNNLDFSKYDFDVNTDNLKSKTVSESFDGTKAGAGISRGILNDPDEITKVPGGSSIVTPSDPNANSFASFN